MIQLVELWLIELAKGIGKFFLNPLIYWSILLMFLVGYKRIRQERRHFRIKIDDPLAEWRSSWKLSLILGLIISLITIGAGMVFAYDVVILLVIVTIILSLTFNYSLLSPSYTLGLTFLIVLLGPLLLEKQDMIDVTLFSQVNFSSLAILLGIFVMAEALLLKRTERNKTFAELVLSERGAWIGQHRIKKLSMIPFFVVVPAGLITPFAPYWPFFDIGGQSYGLLLIPFLLGFNYLVRGELPHVSARKLGQSMNRLGIFILLIALGSIYEPLSWLSIVAVLFAILGREYITYKHRTKDKEKQAYFRPVDDGIKVLAIIPNSPAEGLGILVGEKIVRVNGENITDAWQFYNYLSDNNVNFRLEVLDEANEMRYVQGALYEGQHYELGIIFASKSSPE